MKNRKRIVVAFLLVVALVLGVGYAALTDVLSITGTADISAGNAQSAFDEDIYFSDAVVLDPISSSDKAEVTSDNDVAMFASYGLASKGDVTNFKFTIKNDSDLDVTISPVLTVVGDDNAVAVANTWFSVYSDWNGLPHTVDANSSIEYTVTVELKATPTLMEGELISSTFNITLTAVSEDNINANN